MIDQKLALLQTLWREAAKRTAPIEIPHKSESEAKKRRFDLYNAVKRYKIERELDPELTEAAEMCSISFKDKKTLLLGRRVPDDGLLKAVAGLGIDVGAAIPAPKSHLELKARESERKMLERLTEEQPAGTLATDQPSHRPNRFYDRSRDGKP